MLQAKPAPQTPSQFMSQQDVPVDKTIASSTSSDIPAQLPTMLQPTSVLVKTPASGQLQSTTPDVKQDVHQRKYFCLILTSFFVSSFSIK